MLKFDADDGVLYLIVVSMLRVLMNNSMNEGIVLFMAGINRYMSHLATCWNTS